MARSHRGGPGRPRRPRITCGGIREHRCRVLPGPLDGVRKGLRCRGAARGTECGGRSPSGRGAPHRLSVGPASRRCRTVNAFGVTHHGRRDPHRLRNRNDRAAGRGGGRFRFGVVRDDPPSHRPTAGNDNPQVGAQQDPAHRHPRCAALPGRRSDLSGAGVAHLGHRRTRCPGVRRHDADLRRGGRSATAAHPGIAGADPADRRAVGRPGDPDPVRTGPPTGGVAALRRSHGQP